MRTRTRNVVIATKHYPGTTAGHYFQHRCDGSSYDDNPITRTGYDIATSYVSEAMLDNPHGKGKANQCFHRKLTVLINPEDMNWTVPFASAPYGYVSSSGDLDGRWTERFRQIVTNGQYEDWPLSPVNYNTTLPPRWSSTATGNEQTMINGLFDRAKDLKSDVLLNLVEGHKIWPTMRGLANSIPYLYKNWRSIRNNIKLVSNTYLAVKYGVSPLISDMDKANKYIANSNADLRKRYEEKRRRFTAVMQVPMNFDSSTSGVITFNGVPAIQILHTGKVVSPREIRYVLVIENNRDYATEFFKKAQNFIDRFSTSPFELAWEITPWSFVVDWFIDMRSVLRKLDRLVTTPPYKVVGFTRSDSYHVETTVKQLTTTSCSNPAFLSLHEAANIGYKHYARSVVTDDGKMPHWSPRFGKSQAGSTAALIAQRLAGKMARYI